MKRTLVALTLTLMIGAPFVRSADAFTESRFTHLTFSGAFQLPGVVLPAGTYTFERVAPGVVRVSSQDHRTIYGTFMTIPTLRSERTAKQEVIFGEAPEGTAPPVHVWFPFPEPAFYNVNRSAGYTFLY